MYYPSIRIFIFLGCLVGSTFGVVVWYSIGSFVLNHQRGDSRDDESSESQSAPIGDIESEEPQSPLSAIRTRVVMPRVRGQREPYSRDVQFLSVASRTEIARLAMSVLPPVKCFCEDETIESQCDCSICMEEFKNGELIQPFGVCAHEFHPFCINSWLLSGKTTCPICREELSIILS
ncbi:hypothetical protein VNO78_30389 [Psophocarpus tetragonolobus]|uniref:RING-type domain-containing protein n=1 Tax=Psophocarpus tetragonolobus TaxID=3891 RepID=A0AAN9X4K1_PSOTE